MYFVNSNCNFDNQCDYNYEFKVWTGFCICFLPTSLIMTVNPMPPNRNYPEIHIAGYIIFWCSAFINPIIYTVCNQHYRKALVEMIQCQSFTDVISRITMTNPSNNDASTNGNSLSMSVFNISKRRFNQNGHGI